MTEAQKSAYANSSIGNRGIDRKRSSCRASIPSTDEQRTELDGIETRAADTERQLRAARLAVEDEDKAKKTETRDEPDAEHRARVELRGRARVADFFSAALTGKAVQGASAELQAGEWVRRHPVRIVGRAERTPAGSGRRRDAGDHRGADFRDRRESGTVGPGGVLAEHRRTPS